MSPKKMTQIALLVGVVSLLSLVALAVLGSWSWWPVIGLTLTVLLLVASFLRGAYLSAQYRVEMVDKLNDCYTGNVEQTG